MRLVGPESSLEDTEKRKKFKPSLNTDQDSDFRREHFNITRTEINADFTKTMPNFTDPIENEGQSFNKKYHHQKTTMSVNSDSDEVSRSND